MRTQRQHRIDRALVRILAALGDLLMPEDILRAEIGLHVVPAPTKTEIDEALRQADLQNRLVSIQGETGLKWKLSENGRAWHAENP
ncbi:MAG TPA: hypothetical protein VGD88_06115 [Opitutaceae bacterium]